MSACTTNLRNMRRRSESLGRGVLPVATIALMLLAGPVLVTDSAANENRASHEGVCTRTAELALKACGNDIADNFAIATANCINSSDQEEKRDCKAEARQTRDEEAQLCSDQYASRLGVCDLLGEGPYDPDFSRKHFASVPTGNKYAPLAPGYEWNFVGEGQTDKIRVLDNGGKFFTKDIEGVTCVTVSDVVKDAKTGDMVEDTEDWYAQQKGTNDVWYCGELARDLETPEGDVPARPELVSIDGSFKAGRDSDKPGILIQANPHVGNAYFQEFSLGNAEDVAVVLSTSYVFSSPTAKKKSLDYLVPSGLATRLCTKAEPCVVTREFSPLEPDVVERKYYSPGIGVFLEVDLSTDAINELVSCNFSSKCPVPVP